VPVYEAIVVVKAESEEEARALYESLLVEVSTQPTPLVKVDISLQGPSLTLTFASERRATLRAALNSFLRLLAALEGAARAIASDATGTH